MVICLLGNILINMKNFSRICLKALNSIVQVLNKGCFLKFAVEVGVEESIVNEPVVLKTRIFQIAD
jgi:hypothetical protein